MFTKYMKHWGAPVHLIQFVVMIKIYLLVLPLTLLILFDRDPNILLDNQKIVSFFTLSVWVLMAEIIVLTEHYAHPFLHNMVVWMNQNVFNKVTE